MIEHPKKPLFNKDSSFSRRYLVARQQIVDWNCWAQQNIRSAMRLFERLGQWLPTQYYQISLKCSLVYGWHNQIDTTQKKQRWAAEYSAIPPSISIMTYDRVLMFPVARALLDLFDKGGAEGAFAGSDTFQGMPARKGRASGI
jgi:hypothetical protein